MPNWIKNTLKIALVSFLWEGSLYLTAQYFFKAGADYGYHAAAQECRLYALKELFNGE